MTACSIAQLRPKTLKDVTGNPIENLVHNLYLSSIQKRSVEDIVVFVGDDDDGRCRPFDGIFD